MRPFGHNPGMDLRLRPLRPADEGTFRAAHAAMAAENFEFGLGYVPTMPWPDYLERLDRTRHGIDLPDDRVPATFLVADVGGCMVGRSSIRHTLNEYLAREGGHIGYCVTVEHRRCGFATEILRQSLIVARSVGVTLALLTCDDDNTGSATVIERCGGVFDSYVVPAGPTGAGGSRAPIRKRRYWFA